VPSLEVQTVDPASYYRFRNELDAAGFTTEDGRSWTGPIADPLRAFTTRDEMTILIRDGWPFLHPELSVPGIDSLQHVNALGYVCLWAVGDQSQAWRTLAGWEKRIAEWSNAQKEGFADADAAMDAHAYFGGLRAGALAAFDLSQVEAQFEDGAFGDAYGRWSAGERLLAISVEAGAGVRGLWLYRESVSAPPASLERLRTLLTDGQAKRLSRETSAVTHGRRHFVLFCWGADKHRNVLALLLTRLRTGDLKAETLEFAPSDAETLLSRSGSGASALRGRTIVVFGAGSVGSHVTLWLAESGVDHLILVDGELLRPGNVVRHAAPTSCVGRLKVDAVAHVINEHAPWTKVESVPESPWKPDRISELIQDAALVIDTTGTTGFTEQLSILAARAEIPLVSAALYRGGDVARVQRQGPTDTPLVQREDPSRYPLIPSDPGEHEDVQLEPGCSAPINRASPRAVAALAALAAETVVDALGDRSFPDEITEIYQPLEDSPFDRRGRLTSA
jgi:ThiF family protein